VFTLACPVDCLETVLSAATISTLIRAEYAPLDTPATIGQLLGLLRAGRLGRVPGIGPRRLGEIRAGLVLAGLDLGEQIPSAEGGRMAPGAGSVRRTEEEPPC
jgi:hypothetical protein